MVIWPKELLLQQKTLQAEGLDAPRKLEFTLKLRNLLVGRLKDFADANLYDINPSIYFPVMREYLWSEWGRPFTDFASDLPLSDDSDEEEGGSDGGGDDFDDDY